jgi:integrase
MLAAMRRKRLSSNTVHHAYAVLGKALKDAQRKGLVTRNVCRLVEPPRIEPYKVDGASVASVNKIIASADVDFQLLLKFVARTGVRRGEAVALTWSNVDLDRRVAIITQSAQRMPRESVVFQTTKSAAGKRGIALDLELASDLRHHRAAQSAHALSLGSAYQQHDLVFASAIGKVLGPDRLSKAFKKAAALVGLPKMRLHDLRHAHATALIAAGIHPKVVQERLGHASAAFTMQTYGHVAPGLQEEAARAYAAVAASQSG